jgi:hypothetical protein
MTSRPFGSVYFCSRVGSWGAWWPSASASGRRDEGDERGQTDAARARPGASLAPPASKALDAASWRSPGKGEMADGESPANLIAAARKVGSDRRQRGPVPNCGRFRRAATMQRRAGGTLAARAKCIAAHPGAPFTGPRALLSGYHPTTHSIDILAWPGLTAPARYGAAVTYRTGGEWISAPSRRTPRRPENHARTSDLDESHARQGARSRALLEEIRPRSRWTAATSSSSASTSRAA